MAVTPKSSKAFEPDTDNDDFFLSLVKDGTLDVSKDGKVFNNKTEKDIGSNNKGYIKIGYYDKGADKVRIITAERLIWIVHNGAIPEGKVIIHKDGDTTNNRLDNLELSENQKVGGSFKRRVQARYALTLDFEGEQAWDEKPLWSDIKNAGTVQKEGEAATQPALAPAMKAEPVDNLAKDIRTKERPFGK